jgi:hypothetical protein
MLKLRHIITILSIIIGFGANVVTAQDIPSYKNKGYFSVEFSYGSGIGQINLKELAFKTPYDGYAIRTRIQSGIFLSEQFSLGLGIGLDGYHEFPANTAPAFFEGKYFLKGTPKSFFVSSNFGYAVPLSSNFERGFLAGLAIGKRIPINRKTWMPSIGINAQQITDFSYFVYDPSSSSFVFFEDNIWIKTVSFNVSLVF